MNRSFHTLIDARMLRASGIGVYLQSLLPILGEKLAGSRAAICHPGEQETLAGWGFQPIVDSGGYYSPKSALNAFHAWPSCDTLWVPHFNLPWLPPSAKRICITVHDLFHIDQAFRLPPLQRAYSRLLLNHALDKADRIFTISRFTAQRIGSHRPKASTKVQVIPNGLRSLPTPSSEPLATRRKFILMVGNIKPHKNIAKAIQSFAIFSIRHPDMDLVLIGSREGMLNSASIQIPRDLEDRIHFTGFIPDEMLAAYYAHCEFFLFPSLYEGFGLPVLEAASYGARLCCSDIEPVKEIAANHAIFFDPDSASSMASAMEQTILQDTITVQSRSEWLERYSWNNAADQILGSLHGQ